MAKTLGVALSGLFLFFFGATALPQFKNVRREAGIDFKLVSGGSSKSYILESMSGGVGFIDYNNDGWIDIFLVNGSTLEAERKKINGASDRLYRNNGDGTFTDVTEQAGVKDSSWGMGVCVGDVNNDGFDDLYVTNFGPNVLYLNNRDGTFRDFSRESKTDDPAWSSSAAFGDYDRDGDLDLYVSNYLEFDVGRLPQDSPLCRYRGIKVQCGPRGLVPAPDRFYENLGDGRFIDVTAKSGIARAKPYYGLGVVWGDYDNDADLDIFVANDSTPNYLFRNNGDKTFEEVALLAGVALSEDGREQAGMGVDFADYDNDGDLDLTVTNFSEDYNTLYRNEGDGSFSDISYAVGFGEVTWPFLGWGTQFVDLDLDGWQDLVVANGHVYPEVDAHQLGTTYRQRNLLFRNVIGRKFEEVGRQAGSGWQTVESNRGLAAGDIDNDGQMDLLIASLDTAPLLLRNQNKSGKWVLLKLKGTRSNRSAVGARLTLRAGGQTQIREIKSGGSYQSQSDLRVHFGLGLSTKVDELQVRWPSGKVQKLTDIEANKIHVLEEQ